MSKDQFTVAVVGATGLVGQKMIQVLGERKFPVKKFVPVASERSLDKMVSFQGSQIPVRKLTPAVFSGVD
ncbi:MAG: aspartate-semialdehyde dehydrogenase, partial [Calditrichia bacterium]